MDPLPLNDQVAFDRYIDMLKNLPDRLLARSILMTLIDYEIIYLSLDNAERQRMDRIRNHAYQEIEGEDVRSIVLGIMAVVSNSVREHKVYIFNRIIGLFRAIQ